MISVMRILLRIFYRYKCSGKENIPLTGPILFIANHQSNFDPSIGPSRLIFAFEAVIIGGLGSIWGTLAGGVILGVAQNVGAKIDPGWQILAGHIAFLIVLVVRPNGLFPKTRDD